jgi:hypothetical protein
MKGKYFTLIGTALTLALSSNIAVAQSTKFPELQADKETKSSPQEKELTPDVMEILCKNFPLNSRCPGGTAVKPVSGDSGAGAPVVNPPDSGTQVAPPPEVPTPAPEATPPASAPEVPPAPDSGTTPMTPPAGTGSPEKITPVPGTGTPDGNTSPAPEVPPTPDSGTTPMTPPSGSSNGDTNKITPVPSSGTPDSVIPSNNSGTPDSVTPSNNSGTPDGNVITLPEGKVKPKNGTQLNLPTQTTTPDSNESEKKPASSSDNMKEPSVTSPAPAALPNSGSEVAPTGEMNK